MYLAQFEAPKGAQIAPPKAADVALVGTHDTPTFAGWLEGNDIEERVRHGLLADAAVPGVRQERREATQALAERLDSRVDEPGAFLAALLEWLGRSDSPLVIPWLEDLWLEARAVNLPGTPSSERPNWQRPMRRLLDDIFTDPEIGELLRRLDRARNPLTSDL
jgi:4-alpha-glucanotransferase